MAKFRPGDVIVPKGAEYPDGAAIVSDIIGATIVAAPAGGGFQWRGPTKKVERDFRIVTDEEMRNAAWRPGLFYLMEPEEAWPGWATGARWNGWFKPVFTRSAAESILKALDLRWTMRSDGSFEVVDPNRDDYEPEIYEPLTIKVGEREATMWGIGAGSWTWDLVERRDEEEEP